jgi:hypothetical protein
VSAALVVAAVAVMAGCDDGPDAADDDVVEPHAALGETFMYRGAVDTEAAWELAVTADRIDCDIDMSELAEIGPGEGRFCALHLTLQNTGTEPNVEDFSTSSLLVGTDGTSYGAAEIASFQYADQQLLDPLLGIEPGEAVQSAVVFSVPEDVEPAEVHLQAGTANEFVIVDVGGSAVAE